MKTYDVAIVGAGPAGAIAGVLCAGSGLKTVIIERKPLPRYKSCGGGVTARAMAQLKRINCFDADWFDPFVSRLMIHLPKAGRTYELTGDKPFMGFVRRDHFDMALIRKAQGKGAEVREGEAFHGFCPADKGRIDITTDQSMFKTRVLIGADGYTSRVRRQLAREIGRAEEAPPSVLGMEGDLPVEAVDTLSTGHCHLFFNVAPGVCYGWGFPRGNRLNVGVVIQKGFREGRHPNQMLDGFVETVIKAPASWKRRGGGRIPLFKRGRNPFQQHENVLLIGDAAGFADAWTGEGIYYAIKSARLAHQAILGGFDGNRAIPVDYNRLCRRQIFNELTPSYLFYLFFLRFPRAYNMLAYKRIRGLFLPYTRGELGYPKIFLKALGYGMGYKFGVLSDKE